jgi:hypothetical protein
MSVFNPFKAKTVQGILQDIYDKIDELEIVSEQQELIYDQRQAKIEQLQKEQKDATAEGRRAEKVAAKLRELVE